MYKDHLYFLHLSIAINIMVIFIIFMHDSLSVSYYI